MNLSLGLSSSILIGLMTASLFWMIGPAWDAISGKQLSDLTPRVRALRLDEGLLGRYLRLWGMLMLGVILFLGIYLRMIPIALATIFIIYLLPRVILDWMIEQRIMKLRNQMVGASVAMANACRAGLAFPQALEIISEETPDPLARELRLIVRDYMNGRPLDEAIVDTKERLEIDSFTLFAVAILVCMERGGKLTDALDRISTSLQEHQRLERKLEADTQTGKKVVLILAVFPFLFLGFFSVIDSEGTSFLLNTIAGQVIVAIVILMVYFCVRWSNKILNSVEI